MNHMNMKSALTLGLALTVSMFGSLGAPPKAYAQIVSPLPSLPPATVHPGTVCKAMEPNEALDYSMPGDVENAQFYAIWVTCPLMRAKQTNSNGAHIEVYVTHLGSQNTNTFCKGYSHSYNGTSLAFDQEGWTGSGDGKVILDVSGSGDSNYWSYYVVNCSIPSKGQGRLKSIILKEQ